MAAGDLTTDTGMPRQDGGRWLVTGTVQIDNTLRVFAIVNSQSTILDFQVLNVNGTGTAKVLLNQNASGTTVNGSVAIQAGDEGLYAEAPESVETYRYIAHYL